MDIMYMPMMQMYFKNSNNLTLLFKSANTMGDATLYKYAGMLIFVFLTGLIIEILDLLRYKVNFKISESNLDKKKF